MVEKHQLFDVFTPTTQARLNFVPRPTANDALISALRTPGKQVIVYGETGSGKSTLLQRKLEELYPNHITTRCSEASTFEQILLDAFDALDPYYASELQSTVGHRVGADVSLDFARVRASVDAERTHERGSKVSRLVSPQLTVQRLGEFIGEAGFCWVLEDFHKVRPDQKLPLAQGLKIFSDLAAKYPYVKVVAVGATDTARQVVAYEPEMKHRVAEILVPLMTQKELGSIIDGGEALLNVDMSALRTAFTRYPIGVAAVCHQLALNACLNEGVIETQDVRYVFPGEQLEPTLQRWVTESSDSLKAKFELALKRHRVRKFDNTRLILAALARGPLEGMVHNALLDSIRKDEPAFPAGNLTVYGHELMEEARGALVMSMPDGRYRFVDPLHHTYAQVLFLRRPTPIRTFTLNWDKFLTQEVTSSLVDLSKSWFTIGADQIPERAIVAAPRRRNRPDS